MMCLIRSIIETINYETYAKINKHTYTLLYMPLQLYETGRHLEGV